RHFRERHTLERLHDRTLTFPHDHNLTCERVNYRVGVESFTHCLTSDLVEVRVRLGPVPAPGIEPRGTAPADRLPALRAGAHRRVLFGQKILVHGRRVSLTERPFFVRVLLAAL